MNKKITISFFLLFLLIANCTFFDKKKEETSALPKKDLELNPQVKAKKFAEKGGGILGDFTKNKNGTTYNFATSNIMWRASLNSLKFMPFQSIDYASGTIVTDWYSSSENSRESIKITVRFLSDKVSATSIDIVSHKKKCENNLLECRIIKVKDEFNQEIKDKIMQEVKVLTIQDQKIKKE
jgi:hypothetical protein